MRLHVVDGTYELFRAHYSKRPEHLTPEGRPAKATVGLISSLAALLQDKAEKVTHLAVAFDNPIRSFRNELFPDYKSDEGMDPVLRGQFDAAEEATAALGVVVWSMKQWEADDAMATAAARFSSEVEQVRLLTPDKDFGQCLSGTRVVQVDRMRERVIDEAAFRAQRGFAPESMPDYLALVGDTADGIPGIDGFGEKGASALLAVYPHLEQIPLNYAQWIPKLRGADRMAASLRAQWDEVLLYRRLATLIRDVPLSQSLEQLCWQGVPQPQFEAWRERLGAAHLKNLPDQIQLARGQG